MEKALIITKKYVESEQVYYDSPEKIKYQYELGTKCRAVRFEDGIIAETPRGEIIGRGPLHIKSEDKRDLYYAGYEIRIGAEDCLVNIPETHIQIEPRAEFTPKNSKLIPGIGRIPFPAYRGGDPYIFISYAHSDADRVFAEISRFNNQGYHIWYDEGIAPGNEWEDEIAKRLEGCRLFVVFITKASSDSQNVRDEIYYALDDGKDMVVIYLEETTLSGGLRLRLGSKQAILKHKMSEDEYLYKYTEAFSRYGFAMPVCYKNNEITDNYEPLVIGDDTLNVLAEKLFHDWNGANGEKTFNEQDDDCKTSYRMNALYAFSVARAAGAEIFPADFTMGLRAFPHGHNIDFRIFENAQKLVIEYLSDRGWKNGRYDRKRKAYPLEPLGYRSEAEEDRMERIVRIVQSNGYDYFKPITREDKESLFLTLRNSVASCRNHDELERLRNCYGNFPELEDLINDAHFAK